MSPQRFTGSVEPIASIDPSALQRWLAAIPLTDWPQQNKPGEPLKPAMVSDSAWHGFSEVSEPIVRELMGGYFQGCREYQRMLSVVMSGDEIAPHVDQQGAHWLARVHVPLQANDLSLFIVDGKSHHLDVGMAYRVNTLAVHGVINRGVSPRVHFMFDVKAA